MLAVYGDPKSKVLVYINTKVSTTVNYSEKPITFIQVINKKKYKEAEAPNKLGNIGRLNEIRVKE